MVHQTPACGAGGVGTVWPGRETRFLENTPRIKLVASAETILVRGQGRVGGGRAQPAWEGARGLGTVQPGSEQASEAFLTGLKSCFLSKDERGKRQLLCDLGGGYETFPGYLKRRLA